MFERAVGLNGRFGGCTREKMYRPTLVLLLAVIAVVSVACVNDSTEGSRPTTTSTDRVATTADRRSTSTTDTPTSTSGTEGGVGSSGVIGVIGCSNTNQAVSGYRQVSSSPKLDAGRLGGGTISQWGDPSNEGGWRVYDSVRPPNGYSGTWVQLCIEEEEHGGTFSETLQVWISHIVEEIHRRDPGIPVWVSPLNSYDGIVCGRVGPEGPAIAAETADWAAANIPGVERGPDLGPLTAEHIAPPDNCHANSAGELLLGEQLAMFFD